MIALGISSVPLCCLTMQVCIAEDSVLSGNSLNIGIRY